jgi:hypothetical protein
MNKRFDHATNESQISQFYHYYLYNIKNDFQIIGYQV